MAQITIYLPDDLEKQARKAAKAHRLPFSRWIADQLVKSLRDEWPKGVLDAAGALPDFLDPRIIRKGYGRDVAREPLP
jgi:hypothetical protein